MQQRQTFIDNWRQGFELHYNEHAEEQFFYTRGHQPKVGDLIRTHGPYFVITSVYKESSNFYTGHCKQRKEDVWSIAPIQY